MTEKAVVSLSEARYCTVCNTSLSSPEVAEQHYMGLKHQKALKVLYVAGQSPPRVDLQPEKTDGNGEYYFNSTTGHGTCFVCDVSLTSVQNRDDHLLGKRHMKNRHRWLNERGVDFVDGDPSQLDTTNLQLNAAKPMVGLSNITDSEIVSAAMHQQPPDPINTVIAASLPLNRSATLPSDQQGCGSQNKGKDFWCDICKCEFSGPAPAAQHYASSKHLQKMHHANGDSSTENDTAANISHPNESHDNAWCDVCKVSFTGPSPAAQHYASRKHQQKMQYQSKNEDEPDNGNTSVSSSLTTPAHVSSEQIKDADQCSPQETEGVCNATRSIDFWCSVCKVPLSGPIPATQHYASIKHRQKAESEIGELTQTFSAQISSNIDFSSPAKSNEAMKSKDTWCEVCKVPLSGPLPAAQHYASAKHQQKLRFESEADTGSRCDAKTTPICVSEANRTISAVGEKESQNLIAQNSSTLEDNASLIGQQGIKDVPLPFAFGKSEQSLTPSVETSNKQEDSGGNLEMSNRWCGLCKVPLTGPEPAKQHYESARHKIKLRAIYGGDASPLSSIHGLAKQEDGERAELVRADKTQQDLCVSFSSFEMSFVEESETQSQGDMSTPSQLIDECSLKMDSLHISEDVPACSGEDVDDKSHKRSVGIAACFQQERLDDSGFGDDSEVPDLR